MRASFERPPRQAPPSAAQDSLQIEVVRDRAGFDALEREWNDLFARAGRADQAFQQFNWLWHWANHFLERPDALRIVAGRRGARLTFVWPLVETRLLGLKSLIFMGAPVSQYGDALVEPGAEAELALGWEAARGLCADFAHLRKCRADAAAVPAIAGQCVVCETASAPYANLRGARTFEAVGARQSPKTRSRRRGLARRLREAGAIEYLDLSARDPRGAALIAGAFAIKRAWLRDRGLFSPTIDNDATLAFFLDALSDARRPVEARLAAIACDGRTIGAAISILCKGQAFGHILAHSPAFERQAVGFQLAEHALRSAFALGLERFDTLAPGEPYKRELTNGEVEVADRLVPFTCAGRLWARLWASPVRQWAKGRLKHVPAPLGRGAAAALRRL